MLDALCPQPPERSADGFLRGERGIDLGVDGQHHTGSPDRGFGFSVGRRGIECVHSERAACRQEIGRIGFVGRGRARCHDAIAGAQLGRAQNELDGCRWVRAHGRSSPDESCENVDHVVLVGVGQVEERSGG